MALFKIIHIIRFPSHERSSSDNERRINVFMNLLAKFFIGHAAYIKPINELKSVIFPFIHLANNHTAKALKHQTFIEKLLLNCHH